MYYDKLRKQSEIIAKERKLNIALLIMEALAFSVFFAASFINIAGIIFLPGLMVLIFLTANWIGENNGLLNAFASIEEKQSLYKTYLLERNDLKVKFLAVPKVRSRVDSSPRYYAVRFMDGERNKYYYFFEEELRYDKESIDKIHQKFKGDVSMQCYEGTNIVKTINNDLRFLYIRNGVVR